MSGSVMLNQDNPAASVIPGLTRNPEEHPWIPAFAGMTTSPVIPAKAGIQVPYGTR